MAPRKKAEETKMTSSEKPATRRSARMTRSTAKRLNAKLTELQAESGKKRMQEKAAESKLIKLWMAQGFLRETQNQEIEATGGECFEALAARSFFQDFEKDEDGGRIIRCKMHDIVHDFAQSMTKNESFSVEIDGGPTESKMEFFSRDARHSMVMFRNHSTDSFPATILSFKKLRSLIVDGDPPSMNAVLPNLIDNLSCLRTLNLSGCGIEEVPSTIGKLIHLRHVDLSSNKIKKLPEEVCELYKMQTLDVSWCSELFFTGIDI